MIRMLINQAWKLPCSWLSEIWSGGVTARRLWVEAARAAIAFQFYKNLLILQAIPFAISRGITNHSTLAAMREAERIADDPSVPAYSTRESLVRSLEA